MNWDALGAIAEAVGALAIVVTLVYLSVQVRHAQSASANTNRLMRASGVREMTLATIQNKELRDAVWGAYGDEGKQHLADFAARMGISEDDAGRLDLYAQYYFWLHWGQFGSTMTVDDESELRHLATQFYNVPAIRYAWENSPGARKIMDPNFVGFIDTILKNTQ